MSKPHLREAYSYYYTPINMIKIYYVLNELCKLSPNFFRKDYLSILDFGCGTGAGSIGLLYFLRDFDTSLDIVAHDKVQESFEEFQIFFFGIKELIKRNDVKLRFNRSLFPKQKFSIIIASNLLAELPTMRIILDIFHENLENDGYFLIVEPADRRSSFNLMYLRDRMVKEGAKIALPCLSNLPCPMLKSLPDMWCCMQIAWDRPGFIAHIDDRLRFNKTHLKYSYLVLAKDAKILQDKITSCCGRLVGDIHREKGKRWGIFCMNSGDIIRCELLNRFISKQNELFRHAKRGDILRMELEKRGDLYRLAPQSEVSFLL
jgi:SAM-dependent methyltransferase